MEIAVYKKKVIYMMLIGTKDDCKVEISCSPDLEQYVTSWFEIPILQGDRWESDGMVYLRFEVTPEQYADLRRVLTDYLVKSANPSSARKNSNN